MSLQATLDEYKANFKKTAPADVQQKMQQAAEELRNSEILERVLKIGDGAPHFELENTEGRMVRSEDLLSQGTMVLTFYRGRWWPYCNIELEALQSYVEKFNVLGAHLIAISPQITKFSRTLKKSKKLTFEILGDPGNQVAGQFGLVHTVPEYLRSIYLQFGIDLPRYNADESWTLPLAARFIIDRQAVIRYAETDTDYRVRPEPEHTLKALEAIET